MLGVGREAQRLMILAFRSQNIKNCLFLECQQWKRQDSKSALMQSIKKPGDSFLLL